MIKIGMITTTAPERCGLRVYSEELVTNALIDHRDLHFEFIGRPFDGWDIVRRTEGFDIVHMQHVYNLHGGINGAHIKAMRDRGQKTICTYHEAVDFNKNGYTDSFNRVVVHQKTKDGFDLIYHGVPWKPTVSGSLNMREYIGTSGFPLPFKNYPLAARLARAVGMKLYAILPVSNHGDANQVEQEIMNLCPGSIVNKSFPSHTEMVESLSQCAFTLFPYSHTNTGIGGSMRVGIGAMRPVVISKVIRFQDILEEEKFRREFYVIENPYPTFDTSLPVVQQCVNDVANDCPRLPINTLREMNWHQSANNYVKIYRELMQ